MYSDQSFLGGAIRAETDNIGFGTHDRGHADETRHMFNETLHTFHNHLGLFNGAVRPGFKFNLDNTGIHGRHQIPPRQRHLSQAYQ